MQNIANTRSPPALRDENRSFFITSAVKPDEIGEKIRPAAAKRRLNPPKVVSPVCRREYKRSIFEIKWIMLEYEWHAFEYYGV